MTLATITTKHQTARIASLTPNLSSGGASRSRRCSGTPAAKGPRNPGFAEDDPASWFTKVSLASRGERSWADRLVLVTCLGVCAVAITSLCSSGPVNDRLFKVSALYESVGRTPIAGGLVRALLGPTAERSHNYPGGLAMSSDATASRPGSTAASAGARPFPDPRRLKAGKFSTRNKGVS